MLWGKSWNLKTKMHLAHFSSKMVYLHQKKQALWTGLFNYPDSTFRAKTKNESRLWTVLPLYLFIFFNVEKWELLQKFYYLFWKWNPRMALLLLFEFYFILNFLIRTLIFNKCCFYNFFELHRPSVINFCLKSRHPCYANRPANFKKLNSFANSNLFLTNGHHVLLVCWNKILIISRQRLHCKISSQ